MFLQVRHQSGYHMKCSLTGGLVEFCTF